MSPATFSEISVALQGGQRPATDAAVKAQSRPAESAGCIPRKQRCRSLRADVGAVDAMRRLAEAGLTTVTRHRPAGNAELANVPGTAFTDGG